MRCAVSPRNSVPRAAVAHSTGLQNAERAADRFSLGGVERTVRAEGILIKGRRNMTKTIAGVLLSLLLIASTPGCGTLAFQSRQNQGNTGKIDPNVVIMDSFWLLFFVVPGLVAFTVDICT